VILIDVGNTRLKWAFALPEGKLAGGGKTFYQPATLQDTLYGCWQTIPPPPRILVCNVAGPRVAENLSTWIVRQWGREAEYVRPAARLQGVTCGYSDPDSLGVDRWVSLIAVHTLYEGTACIVGCGTAITIDVLTAGGEHLGGLILPGFTLMRRTLMESTQGIRQVGNDNLLLLGRNTSDAVTAGTLYAAVALIDRLRLDIGAALGEEVRCIVSGGDAETLSPLLKQPVLCEPDLVLRGLAVMGSPPPGLPFPPDRG
jgi:type III pantothenate kinase